MKIGVERGEGQFFYSIPSLPPRPPFVFSRARFSPFPSRDGSQQYRPALYTAVYLLRCTLQFIVVINAWRLKILSLVNKVCFARFSIKYGFIGGGGGGRGGGGIFKKCCVKKLQYFTKRETNNLVPPLLIECF